MVQRAMQRAIPKDSIHKEEDDDIDGADAYHDNVFDQNEKISSSSLVGTPPSTEELIRISEMNKHLQEERNKLMQDLAQAENVNGDLRSQLQILNEKISTYAAG